MRPWLCCRRQLTFVWNVLDWGKERCVEKMRNERIKKYVCGCVIGVVALVSVVGMVTPTVVLAETKNTVVCDDTACWNVTITVPDALSLYVGKQKKLDVQMSKKEGIKKSFQTSDSSIATVSSDGKITGKKKGTVTITTTISGEHVQKELTFMTKVTVKNPSIKIVASKKKVKVGKCITLKVKKRGTSESVFWSVNKEEIATIDKNSGKLTGKKKGNVKVTATCGSLKKSVTIKVK